MKQLGARMNLVICQKSKIEDWYGHFKAYYEMNPCDLTRVKATELKKFMEISINVPVPTVYIINYELAFRRAELLKLRDFTLLLDESSLIQNETAKRSKFALKLGKNATNVILLSGTPTGGKYEKLWSQMHLLGWSISKKMYWNQYVDVKYLDTMGGQSIPIVKGYKNVDRLKRKMRQYGCNFLKADSVMNLPDQNFISIKVPTTEEYGRFKKSGIVTVGDAELVGDTTLTKMLCERQLCGIYNPDKFEAFRDIVDSTNDRLVVFYNFTDELIEMTKIVNRHFGIVNGARKDLKAFEKYSDSVLFVQYQAGAMGLNLQAANKIIYFSPPLSSELFEQSKKRIHRIGQAKPCFYYMLTCKNSIEEKIYKTLEMRQDYTEALFREDTDEERRIKDNFRKP